MADLYTAQHDDLETTQAKRAGRAGRAADAAESLLQGAGRIVGDLTGRAPQAPDALKRHGANLDARDPAGNTPALLAVRNEHGKVVECLAGLGADLSLAASDGSTVALVAADSKQQSVFDINP